MSDTKSGQLASKEATDITGPSVGEQFASWLQANAEMNVEGRSAEVAINQLDRMMNETELEAILDADEQGTHQLRDLVGAELRIPNPGFPGCARKSAEKFSAPLGAYIQFKAFALADFPSRGIAAGDELIISTGAPLVVGKLRTMEANGFLPFDFLVSGTETPNGTVLKLRRIPARKA
jgi:hypothetical protein